MSCDSHGMSFNDARFNSHNSYKSSYMLRTQTESDYAETWYWSWNRRRHQVDNEAFELVSEGRSSRT